MEKFLQEQVILNYLLKKISIRLHKLRSKVDAILIGKNTLLQDDPLLTVRYTKGKNPIRIILDSKGTIPINSRIIKTSNDDSNYNSCFKTN